MRQQDKKWLELCDGRTGMYPGTQQDHVPSKVARRLSSDGLIRVYIPHNPDHKERWVITDAGRCALARAQGEEVGK